MKKFNTFLVLASLLLFSTTLEAQRYLTEIFTDVTIQEDIPYATNIWTLGGDTFPAPLVMDVYTPDGDTETNRPLILYFRTGNFLPNPANLSVSGTKNDSINVELCTRFAKMGYVVANVSYRLGWRPDALDLDTRVNTLINAAYRGVQDARSCVRFFNKSVEDEGNPYGICPTKITAFGEGTGGYVTLATGSLDNYADIVIPKFIGPDINGDGNPDPFVVESVNGDINGETITGMTASGTVLATPNTPGYSSDIQLVVNVGGALGDTSWIDESDPPFLSFHVPTDPNAPYKEDILIVPTTGDLIVEVQGSYLVAQKANTLGLNDVFVDAMIDDEFTTAANTWNDGYEGLFPFNRPDGINPLTMQPAPEGSPWSWWDPVYWGAQPHPLCPVPPPTCSFHVIGLIGNNDMSPEKGRTYADSIVGYFAPRAFAALDLGSDCFTSTEELVDADEVQLRITPNPASSQVTIRTEGEHPMIGVSVFDLSGKLVHQSDDLNTNSYTLNRNGLANGLYIAKIHFRDGVLSEKLMFN